MLTSLPIPVAARFKSITFWVWGFESRRELESLSFVIVVCCQVDVYRLDWSLLQRSPTECDVSECDREASIMRRPCPTRGCCAMEKNVVIEILQFWAQCLRITKEQCSILQFDKMLNKPYIYVFHSTPGSKWSSQLHKVYQSRCTAKNSWWRAERLPETCRLVIPIKLEFSASVGFIHKQYI